jgi:YVTN family beta-propeller protein
MRPKWNARAAVACALVVATVGACGGGGDDKADAGAESFDSAALASVSTGGAKAQAASIWSDHAALPKYAVTTGANSGTVDIKVGREPGAVAVNSKTNKIYVANKKSNSVTVIDGKTNRTTTVKVGPEPNATSPT